MENRLGTQWSCSSSPIIPLHVSLYHISLWRCVFSRCKLKWHNFCSILAQFSCFFALFIFLCKKFKIVFFYQRLVCSAPKCWSKYTTTKHYFLLLISLMVSKDLASLQVPTWPVSYLAHLPHHVRSWQTCPSLCRWRHNVRLRPSVFTSPYFLFHSTFKS